MRLFIALELSGSSIDEIEIWRKPLRKKYPLLKWTSGNQLHVTLRFLGSVNAAEVTGKMKSLELKEFLPVEYFLTDVGSFGNPPSVVWLSGKFSPGLNTLVHRLNSIPDCDGETGESRRFTPHVTVARIKGEIQYHGLEFGPKIYGSGKAVNLISSNLTAGGPVYSNLFSISV